ncbi:MAG TPA: hypothetical protein VLA21_01360 [Candidatus Limnocylindria bacterium]|nr:hypothetical protein [Candidatus Limnocylindria bacterium]
MKALEGAGRRMVFWGGVALILWAAYEFAVMFNAMFGLIRTIFEISRDAQYPLSAALSTMFRNSGTEFLTLLFLLGCVALGAFALLTRGRPVAGFVTAALCALAILYVLGHTPLMRVNLLQKLKLLPFVLVGAGSVLTAVPALRERRARRKGPPGGPPPTRPYDPFRMKGP